MTLSQQPCSALIRSTLQEIISSSPSVCDHALVRPISGEDDPIGSRTASSIHLLITQDGEFVIGSSVWEGEALVVFVLVRIFIVAHRGPVLVVAVALLHGRVDVILRVACIAASFSALALVDVRSRRGRCRKGDEHEGGGS